MYSAPVLAGMARLLCLSALWFPEWNHAVLGASLSAGSTGSPFHREPVEFILSLSKERALQRLAGWNSGQSFNQRNHGSDYDTIRPCCDSLTILF